MKLPVIKELRKANGWSQKELAERISVSKQCICNWENGNIPISIDGLVKLADIFNVSCDFLLGRDTTGVSALSNLSQEDINFLEEMVNYIQERNVLAEALKNNEQ